MCLVFSLTYTLGTQFWGKIKHARSDKQEAKTPVAGSRVAQINQTPLDASPNVMAANGVSVVYPLPGTDELTRSKKGPRPSIGHMRSPSVGSFRAKPGFVRPSVSRQPSISQTPGGIGIPQDLPVQTTVNEPEANNSNSNPPLSPSGKQAQNKSTPQASPEMSSVHGDASLRSVSKARGDDFIGVAPRPVFTAMKGSPITLSFTGRLPSFERVASPLTAPPVVRKPSLFVPISPGHTTSNSKTLGLFSGVPPTEVATGSPLIYPSSSHDNQTTSPLMSPVRASNATLSSHATEEPHPNPSITSDTSNTSSHHLGVTNPNLAVNVYGSTSARSISPTCSTDVDNTQQRLSSPSVNDSTHTAQASSSIATTDDSAPSSTM